MLETQGFSCEALFSSTFWAGYFIRGEVTGPQLSIEQLRWLSYGGRHPGSTRNLTLHVEEHRRWSYLIPDFSLALAVDLGASACGIVVKQKVEFGIRRSGVKFRLKVFSSVNLNQSQLLIQFSSSVKLSYMLVVRSSLLKPQIGDCMWKDFVKGTFTICLNQFFKEPMAHKRMWI